MQDYSELLARADAWYRGCQERHPDKVTCTKGCRDCCLGLFDVTLADAELLREGMSSLEEPVRRDIEARAEAILARLRELYPEIGADLDGWSPGEIDDLCDAIGSVECPVLGPAGECRLYAHRPLTCRLSGVPLVDLSGEVVAPEGCAKCALAASEAPRLDCGRLRRDEQKVLRKRFPGRSGVPILIPQAVAPRP